MELAIDPELEIALAKGSEGQAVEVDNDMIQTRLALSEIHMRSAVHGGNDGVPIGIDKAQLNVVAAFFRTLKTQLEGYGARGMVKGNSRSLKLVKGAENVEFPGGNGRGIAQGENIDDHWERR